MSTAIDLRPAPPASLGMSTLPAEDTPGAPDVKALLKGWRRRGLIAVAVWVAVFAGWSLLAPISGSVVASGLVKVEANRQTVSHRDGGIVAKVLVQEGQIVTQGQPLIVLEDMRVDSTVDLLQAQLVAERLRQSRLEAEAAQRPTWTPPAIAAAEPGNGAAAARTSEALARERSAFDARRRTLQGQLDSVTGQITDTEGEIKAHQRNNVAAAEGLKLLRDEVASNEQLLQENFVNRTRVMTLKRGLADYESRIESTEAELAKARQRKAELTGRITSLRLAYVQTATEELREAAARIVDMEEKLRSGRDAADRQVISAPVAGRLVDLRVNTVGSAVGAREPIVDIVPSDVPLVVETRVAADAVAEVRVGQGAEVKLLGTKTRSQELLVGRVTRVSADALVEQRSGMPYFAVQVEVTPPEGGWTAGLALMPGMSAEVYIKTSDRTALQFLMEPLTAGLRRSFREH
jgi:HlyD family type I secretion membrane fusion protein